ncbi:hypothetical protein SLEP1_g38122 [Rubroshorea leprosula]|uniref:Reverse transcriptase Ty1/copia-type domain-containing protein n=1 Tax=Rubroshorea leprosula TaxID=152421 RepID=A0AAV5KX67_9ROSI|nr:hypothetical protein SLEP1_g38122 [Rubroshorea leprosula]
MFGVHLLHPPWGVPERFWGEAALTIVYLINRIPSSVFNNQSPYERLHGTSNELYNASPHAPTSSIEDDLPAGNALDNFEPSSTFWSVSPVDSTNELVVPSSKAFSNPLWQQAMQDELQALENTRTCDLVDLPAEKSLIGCKWVYKIKTRSDGSVEHYKAHLVAKGFTQEYGIDHEETFAPVACLTSMCSLLAIAAMWRWKLFQMDVKNALLNGNIEEEVYMKPPSGLNHPPNKVCQLRRAL